MAQLPPKAPNTMMPLYWPDFVSHHHRSAAAAFVAPAAAVAQNHHPSWVDEFLNFSSAKRGAHRRSASDSIAFLEAAAGPAMDVDDDEDGGGFDRLDDDQLMSMFSNDVAPPPPPSKAAPSTLSDRDSNNDDKAGASSDSAEDAQSDCKAEEAPAATMAAPPPAYPLATGEEQLVADPKRVKRILANRQSAQRSRVRKLQYISELERSVTTLQTEVSALSPRVAFLDHHRSVLTIGNSHLKQRIAALAQDKIFKDAHQEALKKEIERLREVYHHQSVKKMAAAPPAADAPAAAMSMDKEMIS